MSFDENFYDYDMITNIIPIKPKKKNNKSKKIKFNKNDYQLFKKVLGYDEDENSDSSDDETTICNNPLCDHILKDKITHEKIVSIKNIDDLIDLGKTYHCKNNKEYHGINLRIMCNLVSPLTDLQKLIGMEEVKENIVNQIIFFLQGLNQKESCNNCIDCKYDLPCPKNLSNDMLHTIITGPPGVGKTELGKILGGVYKSMGILSKGHMKVISRSDLVGRYLGHTAMKTQAVIDSCKGGVMFIDEAYALGNPEGRDSFSKECLDTLNQNLTEKRDFLCIIAGYKDALEKCFFTYNEGLRRRFTFRYHIHGYSANELKDIFLLKVKNEGWNTEFQVNDKDSTDTIMKKHILEQNIIKFFKQNIDNFPHYGGDIETFFLNCKIIHSRRVMFLNKKIKKILSFNDIQNGLEKFIKSRKQVKNRKLGTMYS